MQEASPPIVLVIGPFDPSGSGGLPADAVTCAALGAHAISSVSSLHIQDTAALDTVHDVAPDLINDQTRCLLEDMPAGAIKAGPFYNADGVRTVAQIAADYSQVPFLLHLAAPSQAFNDGEHHLEEVVASVFELLLPQTDVVVIDDGLLAQWQAEGMVSDSPTVHPAAALMSFGAQWVLTTNTQIRPGQWAHVLRGPEKQMFHWPWQPPALRVFNQDGPLICALTVGLAKGLAVADATEQAVQKASHLATRFFRPGMGAAIINRTHA